MESCKWLLFQAVWRELFSGDLFETFLAHFNSQNRLWFNYVQCYSVYIFTRCGHAMFFSMFVSFVRGSFWWPRLKNGESRREPLDLCQVPIEASQWVLPCDDATKSMTSTANCCNAPAVICERFVLGNVSNIQHSALRSIEFVSQHFFTSRQVFF